MIEFLTTLFGDELICTSCVFALSRPGHPGIAIHTDSQPYGSKIFGMQASAPRLVRVLYYLDDLTPERAPLKVIPHSHLSLHADANPYKRYLSHPEEVMVTCRAGSAAIINQAIFHANYPNRSTEDRRLLAIAYRPAWAGPIAEVPEWDPEKVAEAAAARAAVVQELEHAQRRLRRRQSPGRHGDGGPGHQSEPVGRVEHFHGVIPCTMPGQEPRPGNTGVSRLICGRPPTRIPAALERDAFGKRFGNLNRFFEQAEMGRDGSVPTPTRFFAIQVLIRYAAGQIV